MTTMVAEPQNTTDALAQVLGERFARKQLRVGTRTSPMAISQAEMVQAMITQRVPGLTVELVGIETSADLWPGDLHELGGKGNFTKEIDRKLIGGEVDIAVHCLKDVPGDVPIPDGTLMAAYLPREDVHDIAVFPADSEYSRLEDLPAGALVGTSSVRRRAQLGKFRPDLRTERCRGNVNSRLRGLDNDGKFAALILARAGLGRIGMADRPHQVLPTEHQHGQDGVSIVPAVGSGVIALQARSADAAVLQLCDEFNDEITSQCVLAERTLLHMLRGHCNSPIAGHAVHALDGTQIGLRGMVFNRDGSKFVHAHAWHTDPAVLGSMVASDLLRQGARELIMATRQ